MFGIRSYFISFIIYMLFGVFLLLEHVSCIDSLIFRVGFVGVVDQVCYSCQ